jgi:ribA/ribD-fused uncharacterized protein
VTIDRGGRVGFGADWLDVAALAGFDEAAAPTEYRRSGCAWFFRTTDRWGGLSNMAAGFPLVVNDVEIRTSEAIYQACRFPHLPDVQREIIAQASPIAAKMKSRAHRRDSRPGWDGLRLAIMWWCLRAKLACNLETFASLLLATEAATIVEDSSRDAYWGAVSDKADEDTLVGRNVLGRLLMLLRRALEEHGMDALGFVPPLAIPDFLLFGESIQAIGTAPVPPEPKKEVMRLDAYQLPQQFAAMLPDYYPMGFGIAPMRVMPWNTLDDARSRDDYYEFQPHGGDPMRDAPRIEAHGGVVYFDQEGDEEDRQRLMTVFDMLGIRLLARDYAVVWTDSDDPGRDGFLTCLRIIGRGAVEAIGRDAAAAVPEQELQAGELLQRFVEDQQRRFGGEQAERLEGLLGGDDARESLCFGVMMENTYWQTYRIWSRVWLVTT